MCLLRASIIPAFLRDVNLYYKEDVPPAISFRQQKNTRTFCLLLGRVKCASPCSYLLRLRESSQSFEFAQKFYDVLKIPINRGESHIRDLVQLLQPVHQQLTNQRGRNFAVHAVQSRRFSLVY